MSTHQHIMQHTHVYITCVNHVHPNISHEQEQNQCLPIPTSIYQLCRASRLTTSCCILSGLQLRNPLRHRVAGGRHIHQGLSAQTWTAGRRQGWVQGTVSNSSMSKSMSSAAAGAQKARSHWECCNSSWGKLKLSDLSDA